MRARDDIPAVAGRDIGGIERREEFRKPILGKPCVGIAKDKDVGSTGLYDSVTKACSGCVTIGSRTPAMRATRLT